MIVKGMDRLPGNRWPMTFDQWEAEDVHPYDGR
jgi:hypothetical protein